MANSDVNSGANDYKIGSMDITEQKNTFQGFIDWAVYGGILIAVLILGLLLVYGGKMPWFTVLVLMLGLSGGLLFLAHKKLTEN